MPSRKKADNPKSLLAEYYYLTKPGIIRANTFTAIAGFLFASQSTIDWLSLVLVVFGVIGLIGGACVINNIVDVDLDKKMKRTLKRALVTKRILPRQATVFAILLLFVGFIALGLGSNLLTVVLGGVAVFWYVVVYGFAKRRTHLSTLIGTVPGALPLVAGYTAVTGTLTIVAALLFLIMVFWQMPHFYAIGIYRIDEYRSAHLPILSVQRGVKRTKIEIILYTCLFIIITPMLSLQTTTSKAYTLLMPLAGIAWLVSEVRGYAAADESRWAKKVFGISLLVLLTLCLLLSLNFVLP